MNTQITLPTMVHPSGSDSAPSSGPVVDLDSLLKVGSKFEKYRIEKLLAKGGMGAVYLVRHMTLDDCFALKVLFPHVALQNRDFVDRFVREAKYASKIRHPNLIRVHDAGYNDKTGLYYLVMDYVPNGNLREMLALQGRILPCGVLGIVRQVANALGAAHRAGIIHRDIKPENIMFDEKGEVRLTDLGIAKSTNSGDTMLTMTVSLMGTPNYMSPEQARDSTSIDERADIYSLGIVLYEMLCGDCPFAEKTPQEILVRVLSEEKAPPIADKVPEISAGLAKLVHDMIEKNPDRRLDSIDTLLQRIKELEDCEDAADPNLPNAKPNPPDSRRKRLRLIIGALSLLIGALAVVIMKSSANSEKMPPQDPPTPPIETNRTVVVTQEVSVAWTNAPTPPVEANRPVVVTQDGSVTRTNAPTPPAPPPKDLIFAPESGRKKDVFAALERAIERRPVRLRVQLGRYAQNKEMSPDSFESLLENVADRLKSAGVNFVLIPDGGQYGDITRRIARQRSCEIE